MDFLHIEVLGIRELKLILGIVNHIVTVGRILLNIVLAEGKLSSKLDVALFIAVHDFD